MNQFITQQIIMTMDEKKVDTYHLITNTGIDLQNLGIENVECHLMKEIGNTQKSTTSVAIHLAIGTVDHLEKKEI